MHSVATASAFITAMLHTRRTVFSCCLTKSEFTQDAGYAGGRT